MNSFGAEMCFHKNSILIIERTQKELLRILDKNRTQLSGTLTEAQKEILQKYDDAVTDMNSIMEQELFIYAFRLGGRFAIETLSTDE